MAKGNNNVKPKRSHLYKPYDSANSSMVSRFTNRVSEILPQPSSWLTRWLTPAEQDNFSSQDEEVETPPEQQPPPLKRLRMQPPPNNISSPQPNHVRNRLGGDPELSPILRSRSDQPDGVVAGPSGLHLRSAPFVASTPAVQVPTEHPGKVNGDEGSDGSESTSGCSSLVPQGERILTAPFPENSMKPSPETPKLSITPTSLGGRRLSIKPKNRTMDLSTSLSRSRPSFDPYAFNNPLNKSSSSLNSSANRTLNDSSASPFYRGRTMYGGNSSCKESLSLSLTSPRVGAPRVVSVKPTSTPVQNRDTISTSALRILKALEQFSTPVSDMKKLPVRSESERRKRKVPMQPFEDLVIPSMPDLLRIKRKERAASESSSSSSSAPTTQSAASTPKPYQLPPPVQPLSARNPMRTDDVNWTPQARAWAFLHLPRGLWNLCRAWARPTGHRPRGRRDWRPLAVGKLAPEGRDDVPEPKRVMKGKNVEEMSSERAESVSLPSVPLPITTLPTFNLSSLPKSSPSMLTPLPPTPSFAAPPTPVSTPAAAPPIKMAPTVNQTKTYKFAQPRVESVVQPVASIKPALKFREPLNAEAKASDAKTTPKSNPPSTPKPSSAPPLVNFQSSPSTFQLKMKKPEEKPSVGFLKTSVDNNAGSITSFLKKEKAKPKEDQPASKPLSKLDGSWTCQQCLVPNPADKDKCPCCESPKTEKKETKEESTWVCCKCSLKNKESVNVCPCGLNKGEKPVQNSWGDLVKVPSDTWECEACLVRNKMADSKCAACTTEKPGTKKPEAPKPDLAAMFKKPEGNWECSACLVSNKPGDVECVACQTLKPGASKPEPPKNNSWGTLFKKPEGNWECSVCMVSNKAVDSACAACSTPKPGAAPTKPAVTFSFGIPATSAPPATASAPSTTSAPFGGFSFGIPPAEKPEAKPTFGTYQFGIKAADNKNETKDKPAANFTFGSVQKRSSAVETKNDEETDQPSRKRVSFGDPAAISEVPAFSFGAPKTEAKTGFTLGGTAAKPALNIFGSTSDAASSSTDAKSSTDKFGAGLVSSNVSSSTDKSDKPPETKPFTFTAPKQNLFPTDKAPEVTFGAPSNPFPSSSADKPFTFGAVNSVAATTADTSKVDGPNVFGKKESQGLFGMPPPSEASAGFFNSTEKKTGPFSVESTDKNIFGGAKPAFPVMNSAFEMKPTAAVNSTGFNATPIAAATVFGSQTALMNNTEKPAGFGTAQSASSPFAFQGADSTPKPSGGFGFPAPAPVANATPNPFGGFSSEAPKFGASQPNAVNNAQPAPMFGAPSATPIFNNPTPTNFFSAPQPEQQQPPQPTATFPFGSGSSQAQAAATPFSFNAMASPAPQPTTFDPNVKPSFNFTGGATPNFAAPPSTNAEPKPPGDRKIRRAVRRNVQR